MLPWPPIKGAQSCVQPMVQSAHQFATLQRREVHLEEEPDTQQGAVQAGLTD